MNIKLEPKELCVKYNSSDIEALEYMLPFCNEYKKKLCERLIELNKKEEDTILSNEEEDEYEVGKWSLLEYFGLTNVNGDAYYRGAFYQ